MNFELNVSIKLQICEYNTALLFITSGATSLFSNGNRFCCSRGNTGLEHYIFEFIIISIRINA